MMMFDSIESFEQTMFIRKIRSLKFDKLLLVRAYSHQPSSLNSDILPFILRRY